MELRAYAKILWRRIWIVALVAGVVAIYVAYQYFSTARTFETARVYQTTISLRMGLPATTHIRDSAEYSLITTNLAQELVDGPTLTSPQFIAQVVQQIKNDQSLVEDKFGANANPGNITEDRLPSAYQKVTRVNNAVVIDINWGTEAGAWVIGHAIGQVCEDNLSTYLSYNVDGPNGQTGNEAGNHIVAVAKVFNEPDKPTMLGGNVVVQRQTTTLVIIFLVGLIIAIALAFLVEYLDDRIHEPGEVINTLQLPLYGEVPHAPLPGRSQAHSKIGD